MDGHAGKEREKKVFVLCALFHFLGKKEEALDKDINCVFCEQILCIHCAVPKGQPQTWPKSALIKASGGDKQGNSLFGAAATRQPPVPSAPILMKALSCLTSKRVGWGETPL